MCDDTKFDVRIGDHEYTDIVAFCGAEAVSIACDIHYAATGQLAYTDDAEITKEEYNEDGWPTDDEGEAANDFRWEGQLSFSY